MLLDPFGLLKEEGLERQRLNPLAPEELSHGEAAHQRQVPAKQNAVEATERTAKLVEGLIQLQDLGKLTVKGVKEPFGVYEFQGVGSPMRDR